MICPESLWLLLEFGIEITPHSFGKQYSHRKFQNVRSLQLTALQTKIETKTTFFTVCNLCEDFQLVTLDFLKSWNSQPGSALLILGYQKAESPFRVSQGQDFISMHKSSCFQNENDFKVREAKSKSSLCSHRLHFHFCPQIQQRMMWNRIHMITRNTILHMKTAIGKTSFTIDKIPPLIRGSTY